jgi:hypothetical protein
MSSRARATLKGATPADKKRRNLIIIIVAVVLVLIAGGTTLGVLLSKKNKDDKKKDDKKKDDPAITRVLRGATGRSGVPNSTPASFLPTLATQWQSALQTQLPNGAVKVYPATVAELQWVSKNSPGVGVGAGMSVTGGPATKCPVAYTGGANADTATFFAIGVEGVSASTAGTVVGGLIFETTASQADLETAQTAVLNGANANGVGYSQWKPFPAAPSKAIADAACPKKEPVTTRVLRGALSSGAAVTTAGYLPTLAARWQSALQTQLPNGAVEVYPATVAELQWIRNNSPGVGVNNSMAVAGGPLTKCPVTYTGGSTSNAETANMWTITANGVSATTNFPPAGGLIFETAASQADLETAMDAVARPNNNVSVTSWGPYVAAPSKAIADAACP